MGMCGECMHVRIDDTGFFKKYYCSLTQRYVSYGGSCSHFTKNDYKGGNSGCFLTSACVQYLGKSDECAELTALRSFRDNYMKATPYGQKLVEEYYKIAPEIVKNIDNSEKRSAYYDYINNVIDKCIKLLDKGENESVLCEYQHMVETLKNEFNL